MVFSPNSSPFAGMEGTQVTAPQIAARLKAEVKTNVSLKVVEQKDGESYEVFGRGELQLGILIETMRREGFELSLSAPRVVLKRVDGSLMEPREKLMIDIEQDHAPAVLEKLFARRAEMLESEVTDAGRVKYTFDIPTRGLIGFRSEFKTDTRAEGIMNHAFDCYTEYCGEIERHNKGALIAHEDGKASNYGISKVEPRGVLFIETGQEIYQGMVIGECARAGNVIVNPVNTKQLTNFRVGGKEDTVRVKPPRKMSLEDTLAYVRDDELIEVTPKNIRLRKLILDPNERKRAEKASRLDIENA
jgi:GTP-binding protein